MDVSSDTKVVMFDLETTGLSKITCEICQIAAKFEEKEFSVYTLPKKGIPRKASMVTGLTIFCGKLFLNGKIVATTPTDVALHQFIAFLRSIGPNIVLAAHNGNKFDAPIILREMKSARLLDEFIETVKGFIDTVEVYKVTLPQRKSYTQTSLAADYCIANGNAHNALGDVRIMDKLLSTLSVKPENLLVHVRSVRFVIEKEHRLAQKPIMKAAWEILKTKVFNCMINKMVDWTFFGSFANCFQ